MSCRQLGVACYQEFHAASCEKISDMSSQHGMEMFQKKDVAHLKAMDEMRELMQQPEALTE
jgi:hypothetical protein